MTDKIIERDGLIVERFSCSCCFPGHILDLCIELDKKGNSEYTFNFYMDGKAPIKYRLKQIWNLLRGEEGSLCDFILRQEDLPRLIELLSKGIKED